MEKKVPLMGSRNGETVIIGEATIKYNPKKQTDPPKVLGTTIYSEAVIREIGAAAIKNFSTPQS